MLRESAVLKKIVKISFVFLILISTFFILKIYGEVVEDSAVVLLQSQARSGPDENAGELFDIPEGKIARVISENGGWTYVQIEYENEKLAGWVESGSIGKISG
jgi:hypothetical protein